MAEQVTSGLGQIAEDVQNANMQEVHELRTSREGALAATLPITGFSYRHDWGPRNGQQKLTLAFAAPPGQPSMITADSRVFVSIGEGAPNGGKFIGAARYTLHNVAPQNGLVSIWVNIEWNFPIRLSADYLIINP